MPSQIAEVMVPPPVATPRGAAWASRLFETLLRLGNKTWRAMEIVGQARARRELLLLAERHADRPDFARQLRQAARRGAMSRD
jgi:hypothetical protein